MIFSYPLPSDASLRWFPSEYCHTVKYRQNSMVWLFDGEKSNSGSPRIRHQQCVVSLVYYLISAKDMIPLCGTLSECHHTHIGRYQPGPRACSRRHSVFGLFWSALEYTTVSLADQIPEPGGRIVGAWTRSQLTTHLVRDPTIHPPGFSLVCQGNSGVL